MEKFEFFSVPRIVFGRGEFSRLAELCAGLGKSVLIVTNVDDPGSGGVSDRAMEQLSAGGLRCTVVSQRGEPEVQDVDRAVEAARACGCDALVGLGGGSAIDLAKATAGLLTNGGACLDYMEVIGSGRKITRPAAPWIAVPTTAGTGAEATRNAVIACREKRFKASIRGEHLLARAALIDPELAVSLPPDVTACSGMDALCQLIEAYTSRGANSMTDAIVWAGIERAGWALRRAYGNGKNLDAREDMALAALWSGIALANAGLGAVHGLAAPLGASFPAPHGAVCAALLPHVMRANAEALEDMEDPQDQTRAMEPLGRYARVGRADVIHMDTGDVTGRYARVGRALTGSWELQHREAIDAGISFTSRLVRDLRIPALGRFGLTEADVPAIAAAAGKSSSMKHNPVELSEEALTEILRAAL